MANIDNHKSLLVQSIGVCVSAPDDKKKDTCLVVAYSTSNQAKNISFVAVKMPPHNVFYDRTFFLDAICRAEKVKQVTYVDFDGCDKDIYLCRAPEGVVIDVVSRDDEKNIYGDGFAEIESGRLNFSVEYEKIKLNKKLSNIKIKFDKSSDYPRNSLAFAIVNAYNACLLGRVFSREEFRLRTSEGKRVKFEVRSVQPKAIYTDVIYVKPHRLSELSAVASYVPETIHVIDGNDVRVREYIINYDDFLKDYQISTNNN